MFEYDFVILTDDLFVQPPKNRLEKNGWEEDRLLLEALEKHGLKVGRKSWADPDFDWSGTQAAIFRTTWDYFDRFGEWKSWLNRVSKQTRLVNPIDMVWWNMDKHYLGELAEKGIRIPETRYLNRGTTATLASLHQQTGWQETILKPCVAGSARHTYRLNPQNLEAHEAIFAQLTTEEDMMLQPFQKNILSQGELSIMIIGGKFTHAVVKKVKAGDFRVQDNFGGTVALYEPTASEIDFAEKAVAAINPLPAYARVDIIYDNQDELALIEIELIEPELWFRLFPAAAEALATHLASGQM